ncbi:hypothetical protein IFM47457_08320 [Aspergillus lentulus]|nr:hypothetical protein IFM47457_08320 [Aspergillus lentulus]
MEIFFITLAVIFVPVLVFLIYLPINGERYSAAAESYPNACQDYSEATNPPTLETESFESGRSHLSPCLNTCQDCSEVPKPPPVTDPCIPDYYCRYYCHYDDHHYRTKDWTDRKAPKPPPVTDPCIVYYYYYCYSYYYGYHYANDRQTHSKVKNTPFFSTPESSRHRTSRSSAYSNACQDYGEVPKPPPVTDPHIVDYYYNYYCHYYDLHYPTIGQPDSEAPKPPLVTDPCIKRRRRAFSSRIPSPVRPAASHLTAAASSHASARKTQQMNIGRPRASILKSVYMTSWASRIPRLINRDKLHCRSRPKKVTFGEIREIQFYK